jgi:hypothetical protein
VSRQNNIRMIFVAARQLGLDEETRRDLQLVATGKTSLTDMSDPEVAKVLTALKTKGFKSGRAGGKGRAPAARGDIRFAHVLWGKLVAADAVQARGAVGLNAFVRARFEKVWGAAPLDIDQMRDAKQIATIIQALKGMCDRAGVEY